MAYTLFFQNSTKARIMVLNILVLTFSFALIQCNPSSQSTGRANKYDETYTSNGKQEDKNGEDPGEGTSQGGNGGGEFKDIPLGELLLMEQERRNQDLAEEDELVLLDAINTEFCKKLEDKRKNCPAIKRLIFDPTERSLRCDGESEISDTAPKIEVTIPDTKSGSFVLLANDLYKSSTFGPGTTEITFSSESGGEFQAPPFIKVYKLVLRSYNSSGELIPLPSISAFNVRITIDGNELLDDYAAFSEDSVLKEERKEYRIPVNDIIALRKSPTCLVDQKQIDTLRTNISNTITADQVLERKKEYKKTKENLELDDIGDPAAKRAELVENIYKHQTSIEYRFPLLEAERNRQFKLVNELKTDVQIGCQYMQPIQSFEVELEGNMNMPVYLGQEDGKRPDNLQDGPATELLLDFGGVKFSVDFTKQDIFGIRYPLQKDVSDEAIIGELDRIYIRKKGATFNNVQEPCDNTGGVLGKLEDILWDETCYDVYEVGTFNIDAITIWVNGKHKAYARSDLGISLDRNNKKWSGSLQSNEKWVQLMLDDTCESTN